MTNYRLRVYLAAPLFNDRERSFNQYLTTRLEAHADVFLPQRDGALLEELVARGVPLLVAEQRVFEQDVGAMTRADVLIAILDGSNVDEGVAFEAGYMRALGKVCVGLQTDIRRQLPTGNNPMISRGLHYLLHSADEVLAWIEQYSSNRKMRDIA